MRLHHLLALALALLPFSEAKAASGIVQVSVKDAGGTNRNFNVLSSDGTLTGNLSWNNVICDPTTPTQCAAVSAGGALSAAQSGTWNITNVSGTVSLPTGASTAAKQPALGTAGAASADVISVQGIASMTPLSTTVSGTAAVTQSGTWSVRNLGNAGAITDFAGQNASSPANAWLIGGQFNTAPTTITNGNASPLQLDNAGNLLVNVKTGSAGLADEGTYTQGTTNFTPAGCFFASAITNLSNAQGGAVQCTVDRNFFVNLNKVAGTALTAPTAYGSAPSGNVIGVNANVTNANANGQAAMANSSPVVLASNQTAADPCMFQAKTNVAVSTASGTVALVTGVSAKKIYVCSLSLVAAGAISVSLAEGSSNTCGTSAQAAVLGVATSGTAANGIALPANGGLTLGNGGGTVAATATNANYLCLFQSGTTQIAGNLTYVQQ
jgi:hypothetical protein